MKLSTRSRYALRALVDLAENSADSCVSLGCIAKRQSISVKYLESLFTRLAKQGILTSRRGVSGGYALAKTPDKISAWDVMAAAGDTASFFRCLNTPCTKMRTCRTRPLWDELADLVENKLRTTSIRDLMKKP